MGKYFSPDLTLDMSSLTTLMDPEPMANSGFTGSNWFGGAKPATSIGMNDMMSYAGPIMGIAGAIQTGYGAYLSAKMIKQNLEMQSYMAGINARMAENTAQSIFQQGERLQGEVSLRAGKVKAAQTVEQAARGVQIGVGNAAEEIATTDLMKEIDMLTINANTVRSAWNARMQATNYANASLLEGTSARSINPYATGMTTLIDSGTQVAQSWYKNASQLASLAALGLG